MDTDYLIIIAQKKDRSINLKWQKDDFLKVYNFFERWHSESIYYRT